MRKLLIALALVTASTACAAAEEPSAAAPTPPTSSALPTENDKDSPDTKPPKNPAPDFTVTTFDGDRFSLGEQRGTPVVLNFWESW